LAGERTVTLTVQNMYCSACPIAVKSVRSNTDAERANERKLAAAKARSGFGDVIA
jgi:hypothetical protein